LLIKRIRVIAITIPSSRTPGSIKALARCESGRDKKIVLVAHGFSLSFIWNAGKKMHRLM
jgi:hypothetical protein